MEEAPLVIGVGPGFTAGKDCRGVIETKRGHYLGKVIREGSAIPNTGIPGNVGGYTIERIIRASADGDFQPVADIGDLVEKDQIIAISGGQPVYALMSGIVRGMLQAGVKVKEGMKCGDIDARCERNHCFTISDKARSIGGGVLEAVVAYEHGKF
jgi:xanthine dehydrogenase accessory factor